MLYDHDQRGQQIETGIVAQNSSPSALRGQDMTGLVYMQETQHI